jgi:hypothetical protein
MLLSPGIIGQTASRQQAENPAFGQAALQHAAPANGIIVAAA